MPQDSNRKSQRPKPSAQPKPLSLPERVALAKQKAEKWGRAVLLPNLEPGEAALAATMKRSAEAELALGHKALAYNQPNADPEVEKNLALYRLLRLPLPTSQPLGTPSTSDSRGTSEPRT